MLYRPHEPYGVSARPVEGLSPLGLTSLAFRFGGRLALACWARATASARREVGERGRLGFLWPVQASRSYRRNTRRPACVGYFVHPR